MFKKIIGFFTGANKKEAEAKAERERKILEDKELAIARRRAAQITAAAPSMPPRNYQSINRVAREKKPVEVRVDYRGYQGGSTDNTSLTMMAAMVALDDTPSRSYSHSSSYSSYDSSSSSSSSSDSSSSSSCSGGGCD